MLTSSAMWWDTGVSSVSRSDGDGVHPQLQGQVGDGSRQVGVAGPLAVAVDASLHVGGAPAHRGQRVGHGTAAVVVEVDTDLGLEAGRARRRRCARPRRAGCRRWCRTGPGSRPPPPRRPAGCAAVNSGLALYPSKKCSASRKTRRSLARRNSTESATMATASSSVVRRASTTCISEDLATMHTASVWASTRWRSVSSSSALTPARRVDPKATRVDRGQGELGRGPGEELRVLGVGPGPPTFDEGDPEVVELLGHPQLVVDGQGEALLLGAVPQGGVEDIDGVGKGG